MKGAQLLYISVVSMDRPILGNPSTGHQVKVNYFKYESLTIIIKRTW